MNKTALVIGYGEVGRAHFEVLSKAYPGLIFYKDKSPDIFNTKGERVDYAAEPDIMLIATQCDPNNIEPFINMVRSYYTKFKPRIIDILTTCPTGTCEAIQEKLPWACSIVNRSSTRGMHPNLAKFLYDIPKHIGGPQAEELALWYKAAGIPTYTHSKARTVEFSHYANNFIYGANIMAWDEVCKAARDEAVDIMEVLEYRKTNNSGFIKAGYASKVSPILYPTNGGGILGHCVVYAASCFKKRGPIMNLLANWNKSLGIGDKHDTNA